MIWQAYRDEACPAIEDFKAWFLSLNASNQTLVKGQIEALRSLAATGEIEEGDEDSLKPISIDPDIYELKWRFRKQHLRQYHAEPRDHPRHLVDLHFHVKTIVERDKKKTKQLQDEQIAFAALRYRAGERRSWGIV